MFLYGRLPQYTLIKFEFLHLICTQLHSVSCFFFLYRSPSLYLCTVFDSVSSNIDEILSINPSENVFVFGDFNVHHKDWFTYSGRTDRSGELCHIFTISNDLTQMINSPTWITDCDSHSPAFLDLFISSDTSICSTMAFPPFGKSAHLVVSASIDFPSYSQWTSPFHCTAYDYSHVDWDGFRADWHGLLEIFHGRIFLNSVLLLLQATFLSRFRLELMYISLIERMRSNFTHLHGFQRLVLLP